MKQPNSVAAYEPLEQTLEAYLLMLREIRREQLGKQGS